MSKTPWGLQQEDSSKRWMLHIPKHLKQEQCPRAEEVLEAATASGVNPHAFRDVADIAKDLANLGAENQEHVSIPIVIESSFDVRISISLDKTKASLYVRKPLDINQFDASLIFSAIKRYSFANIDAAKIKKDIEDFINSQKMEFKEYCLVEGISPTRGKDRTLLPSAEFLAQEDAEKIRASMVEYKSKNKFIEDEIGLKCEDVQYFALIEKEQIVCSFSEPEYGNEGLDVYGKIIPGLPGNDPYIHPDKNLTITPTGLKSEIEGLLLYAEVDGETKIRVIPFVPAKIELDVSDDKMLAVLQLEAERGAGTPLTLELVKEFLEKEGIKGEIDYKSIERAIIEAKTTNKRVEVVAVRGERPVAPGCSKIYWHIGFKKTPDKTIVYENQTILSFKKMESGCAGTDVFGTILSETSEHCEIIPVYDETIVEREDNGVQILVAATSGELHVGETLSIHNTKKYTGDIDDRFGNVDFPGNFELTGNIDSGKKIKASGYIHVSGHAKVSLLTAEDSVTMIGGIKGGGKGTVWAKKEIHLSYAENARILAGFNISIEDYCFNCVVKTNGQIIMSGAPGVLLGGSVRASKGLHVLELGSAKRLRTNISFGQNYLVGDQIEVSERESENIKEAIEKINIAMEKTSKDDPAILELRKKKIELLKRNDTLTVRIFTLKEQFESHIISAIRVERSVYPGVVLESHGRYYEVREKMNHVMFIFDQTTGQIRAVPIPED